MPTIFNSKDSVFFVGGRGTKAGDANAGGCTQAFWGEGRSLADIMNPNGAPLSGAAAWNGSQTACTVEEEDEGSRVKIERYDTEDFRYCLVGHIVNVNFAAVYTDGWYEVVEIDEPNGDYVIIDLTHTSDTTCDAKVGGAFDKAQTAWAVTDATQGYNVTIHSNKSQSKTNGDFIASWLLGDKGGSLVNKSFKRFCGFTTQPGDGGQIIFDGEEDEAFSPDGGICFNLNIESVIFENVIVKNAYQGWRASNIAMYSVRFINCEGNSGSNDGWRLSYGRGFVLIDCRAKDNGGVGFSVYHSSGVPCHLLINCIASGNTKEGFYRVGGYGGAVALGCLAYDNGKDGTPYSGFLVYSTYGFGSVVNCVAYDNGKHGFEFQYRNPVAINCIAKNNGQWGFFADDAQMAPHVAYCCAHGNGSGQFSLPDALPEQNCIEEDPEFADAANGDFRPRNPAVLRGGKPDISSNPTQMGAVLQKYQFGDRERVANMARLRIIR